MFKFLRNVKLRAFFDKGPPDLHPSLNPSQTVTAEPSLLPERGLRAKSTFVPPAGNPSVATFCRLVEQDTLAAVQLNNKKNKKKILF